MKYDIVATVMEQARRDMQLEEDRQVMKYLHKAVIIQDIRGKSSTDAIYILALKYGYQFAQEKRGDSYIIYAYEHIPGEVDENLMFYLEPHNG